MNRAQRYSGMTLTFAVVLSLAAGVFFERSVVGSIRKPEIRTVVQSPNHVAASMMPTRVSNDRAWAAIWSAAAKVCPYIKTVPPQTVLPGELEACLDRLVPPPSNREGHAGAVTPQPYSLHPGMTPLLDPTQDAYYRSLLRDGRFPTTGSAPGRPR